MAGKREMFFCVGCIGSLFTNGKWGGMLWGLLNNINKMKIVGLISGGKDSIYNVLQCLAAGHDVVALANISPKSSDKGTYSCIV